MPRTKEQNEAIKLEKKQLIMDVALRLFAENGYANTSIDKIAKSIGIAKGLLYTYFKNKEDLLYQILLSGIDKMSIGVFSEVMTAKEFVEGIEKVFDNVMQYKDFFKLYTALSVQPGIVQNLAPIADSYRSLNVVIKYFHRRFGENAMKELLLFSTLSKGFSVLAMFGDGQRMIQYDLLEETILDFFRKRYGTQ
ncbi:MAG: TetR/AcrR family transcriptional regulator [Tannerella sp.]|jgi:AcrR family transcriptional regulator|nr:TetR/AcrR family transcriptional regulator [Tannerella sp.]